MTSRVSLTRPSGSHRKSHLGMCMRKNLVLLASALLCVSAGSAAHNAETHRDATAYAFELMAVAGKSEIRQRFAGNAEMLQFIDAMTSAARFYEGLPADL